MKLYGIIGYPLSHSFSKKYFTEKFQKENLTNCAYENFPLQNIDQFPALIAGHSDLKGLNVTIPYKEVVVPYLHEKNEIVKSTGACNCIKVVNGKLKGFNTDVFGFEKSLQAKLKPNHKKALILGTGGAAKAEALVFDEIEDDRHRFLIGNEIGLVDFDTIDDRRHAAKPDAFGNRTAFGGFRLTILEQVVHRRAARIGNADCDSSVFLTQEA